MMRTYFDDFNADFTCKNCGRYVSARTAISGVVNRNHCPYCLHSRHVDLFEAGDRLCACKGVMAPVGLTVKRSRDKYARGLQGELMLVHRCETCGGLSINRIAADDDAVKILESLNRPSNTLADACLGQGITLLAEHDLAVVEKRLYGGKIPAMSGY
ncbi:MAG: RNHCP domain-containing protein [Anaerolineaceae bacterium]|nr:RNHCP domain-containing protein [Anaerolineaceae bacterium]